MIYSYVYLVKPNSVSFFFPNVCVYKQYFLSCEVLFVYCRTLNT